MGNICGKTESEPSQPGRPLGSAPPPGPKTSRVPPKVGGPPRTLGGAGSDVGSGVSNSSDPSDARRKAAEAAEARAKASSKGGKLQSQLNAQKKQNRNSTLAEASNQELRARDADEAANARNWE
ncbi:hypothetical protein TGAM01_v207258 [Trichoderma gamsii]|uniref:Uncharacterized protein n=1 Tax=Trichoderma gamsii TaxID=398673 RepID=A0A0W7VUL7_9HYPO|nr:hypothetical protein TGAM01_v207258 [Trichoderma gamsii]PNP41449.1 hypothetical protein TGAMA5MH_06777 [Trichoderma gamsii]PON23930.1 hypothetical protein TGAM01_v207258 [Trichoderma gamsii]